MTEPVSDAESDPVETRCGYVALAGRPNVGKSTLMNHLLGRKLSITSRKPQTTRQALIGVLTRGDAQIVFVDTPGIHLASGRALNRYMVGQAVGSLAGVELALMLVEASGWHEGDEIVLRRIREAGLPCICVINKIDRLQRKERLLPLLDGLSRKHDFEGARARLGPQEPGSRRPARRGGPPASPIAPGCSARTRSRIGPCPF